MKNGKRVSGALRAGREGGIPWFAFLDPSRPLLTERTVGKEGGPPPLVRREEAVLATADAEAGNVGCPMTKPERAHFARCLRTTRNRISDKELARIETLLAEFAGASRRGE